MGCTQTHTRRGGKEPGKTSAYTHTPAELSFVEGAGPGPVINLLLREPWFFLEVSDLVFGRLSPRDVR